MRDHVRASSSSVVVIFIRMRVFEPGYCCRVVWVQTHTHAPIAPLRRVEVAAAAQALGREACMCGGVDQ